MTLKSQCLCRLGDELADCVAQVGCRRGVVDRCGAWRTAWMKLVDRMPQAGCWRIGREELSDGDPGTSNDRNGRLNARQGRGKSDSLTR